MKRTLPILIFAILFLFFIQSAGTLVESIYILDLLHTSLDAKVLGLLFFFLPLVLLPFQRRFPAALAWITCAALLLGRSLMPFLGTSNRLLASGLATAAALSLFLLMLEAEPKRREGTRTDLAGTAGTVGSTGLALAVGLSVLLRTLGLGLDASLSPSGAWIGILLGLVLALLLTQMELKTHSYERKPAPGVTGAVLGIFLVLTLVYFAFSAPAVMARWSQGNYPLIVALVSLLSLAWLLLNLFRPRAFERLPAWLLLAWNLAFTLCLTGTLLVMRVPFPASPDAPAVTVNAPLWWQQVPMVLMLLLFPVLFLDLRLFLERIGQEKPSSSQLAPGLLLGSLALILLVFVHIFSNVWGYVEPVSPFFRNKFWLAYFLPSAGLCLLTWGWRKAHAADEEARTGDFPWAWRVLAGLVFLVTLVGLVPGRKVQVEADGRTSLLVMTYNIQEANDRSAEKSFADQLALIRRVSPDILALQETDSARISLNNNDYVRYYAGKLGYYSYYGPTTVAGTYGTAILSKFPLQNTRSVFTYSDTDEIGVAETEVEVGGRRFSIYDVHPDGSDAAMLAFANALINRTRGQAAVIALGDYNLRDTEAAYQLLDGVFTNAWTSVYPTKVGAGVDMSGRNRIDHIFVSRDLSVHDPVYLLPPASATDHPVHWAVISWVKP